MPVLGILGGGQLGRMSAQAAAKIGIDTVIYCPEENSPASQVASKTFIGAYSDQEKLKEFAAAVDYISYEFENIPTDTVRFLKTLKPVYPDDSLLEVAQDRIAEKTYLNKINIDTASWEKARSLEQVNDTLSSWKHQECIIKTTRFGYDGKGQFRYDREYPETAENIPFGTEPLIIESIVPFAHEISVIVARDKDGKTVTYGPMLNIHKNHILDVTTYPSGLPDAMCEKAIAMTTSLANAVNLQGVLTLEMFVTEDGDILANEIAPRTHNSGHWTIEACAASQFENHVRTVCDLPATDPGPIQPAKMINLIGEDILNTASYEGKPNTHIHNYGKTDAKPGRKMGHVTILETIEE